MKTFTKINKFPEGSSGFINNERSILVVWADPKREGLYRMTEFQTNKDGKVSQFSGYFGKCNQEKILKLTESMIEVL